MSHFVPSIIDAPGSSETLAQLGPDSPNGRSERLHTSALFGAIRRSTHIGIGSACKNVKADSANPSPTGVRKTSCHVCEGQIRNASAVAAAVSTPTTKIDVT